MLIESWRLIARGVRNNYYLLTATKVANLKSKVGLKTKRLPILTDGQPRKNNLILKVCD